MDYITQAIVFALSRFGEEAIKDTYKALKSIIISKYGLRSDLVQSIELLESKPDSKHRKGAVHEAVVNAKANEDAELLEVANKIFNKGSIYEINSSQKVLGDKNILVGKNMKYSGFDAKVTNGDLKIDGDVNAAGRDVIVNPKKENSLLGCSGKVVIGFLFIIIGLYGLSSFAYIIGTQDFSESLGFLISIGLLFILNKIYKNM